MDVDGAQATAAPPKASTKPASKAPKPPPSAQGGAAGAAAAASENDDDGDGGDEKAGDDKRERKQRRASATGSKKIKAQLGGEESAEEDSGSVATEPGEEEEETESVSMEEEDDETPAKGSARRKSQATGGGSGSGAGPSSSIRKDTDKLLEKLRDEVAQLDGTLEEGWTVKANVRTGGATAGTYDVYYIAPNGKRYRSRTEVFRALGLIEGGPVSAGKRSAAGSGAKRSGKPAPPLVPTDVAYANAKTRAEGLQDKSLPLAAEAPGVLVHRLGELSADRGFHCAGNLWPVGFAATWQQQPAAGAGGEASGSSAGPVLVSAIARGASGAAFRVYISKPEGGGSREQLAEAAAASGGGDSDQLLLLAEASHPDAAWKRVAAMHAAAHGSNTDAADKPSKPAGEAPAAEPADAAASAAAPLPAAASPAEKKAPELTVEQHAALQALPTGSLPPKPWGLQLYGLTTPAVLQLLEALPAADACSAYLFAEQRGGWDAVVQQIKIDQLKAAGLRKRASGAADGDGAKRPRKSGAGGQRTLESFFALKVTDAKDADEFAGQAYDPSDEAHISSQVTKLLNIMIDKVGAPCRPAAVSCGGVARRGGRTCYVANLQRGARPRCLVARASTTRGLCFG